MDQPLPDLCSPHLLARVEELGTIGATPEEGARRLALTDEDKVGRDTSGYSHAGHRSARYSRGTARD